MAEQTIDVLMRVVGASGPLAAESFTVFATSIGTDTLRDGFVAGQFCELREFSFSAGLEGSLSKSKQEQIKKEAKAAKKNEEPVGVLSLAEKRDRLHASQQQRSAKRHAVEFVDMQPVDFTRVMDSASTLLFKAMVECETLPELSIVKRKAAGSKSAGECYLRLDFQKVLVTKLEWKDSEHIMLETGSFIYRKVTIRYRPQKYDGGLGTVIQSSWTMPNPEQIEHRTKS